MTCSFTGYRPQKIPFEWNRSSDEYKRLYNLIKNEMIDLIGKGVKFFQSGMALGVDLMCAEIVLELAETYDIKLFCIVPCLNQTNGWNGEDKALYESIISRSAAVTYVTEEPYKNGCMMKRNRFLVDTAQYIIAVFDGKSGGTMSTVKYAKNKNRTVIAINPADFSRVELIHGYVQGVLYV